MSTARTIIDRSGKVESEISHRINKAISHYYQVDNTVKAKREVKLKIFKTVHLPILLYGTENWALIGIVKQNYSRRNEVPPKTRGQPRLGTC